MLLSFLLAGVAGERAGAYIAGQVGQSRRGVKCDYKEPVFETGLFKKTVPANGLPQGIKPVHSVLLPSHIFAFLISISVYIYSCLEKSNAISFKVKISDAVHVVMSPAWRGK